METGLWEDKEIHDVQTLLFYQRIATTQANTLVVQAYIKEKLNKGAYEQRFQELVKVYDLDIKILPFKARWNKHVKGQVTQVSTKNANERIKKADRLKGFYPFQKISRLKPYLQILTFRGRKHLTKTRLNILALNEYTQRWNKTGTESCETNECGEIETLTHFLLECDDERMSETRNTFFAKLNKAFRTELEKLASNEDRVKTLVMLQGRYNQEESDKAKTAVLVKERIEYTIVLGNYLSDLWTIRARANGQRG
jgi:hypothetical protein